MFQTLSRVSSAIPRMTDAARVISPSGRSTGSRASMGSWSHAMKPQAGTSSSGVAGLTRGPPLAAGPPRPPCTGSMVPHPGTPQGRGGGRLVRAPGERARPSGRAAERPRGRATARPCENSQRAGIAQGSTAKVVSRHGRVVAGGDASVPTRICTAPSPPPGCRRPRSGEPLGHHPPPGGRAMGEQTVRRGLLGARPHGGPAGGGPLRGRHERRGLARRVDGRRRPRARPARQGAPRR